MGEELEISSEELETSPAEEAWIDAFIERLQDPPTKGELLEDARCERVHFLEDRDALRSKAREAARLRAARKR